MQPVLYYIEHPARFMDSLVHNFGKWLPDSTYIKLRYRFQMGKKLNLNDPKTFQEKLQWLKIYDRNPEYTKMVDKILVKDYVSSRIGREYVVPLLGVWNKPEDIDWASLPERFVLKTNHGGGNTGVVICRDKNRFVIASAIAKLNYSLKMDVYYELREWPYKSVNKKVFAEALIETKQDVKDLPDYKWYCFNGEPKFCQLIQDRTTHETIDFYDTNWERQEFVGLNPNADAAKMAAPRPSNLETQIRIARDLSQNIPFSRIDIYDTGDKIFFGEITFYPLSGMGSFRPEKYNDILGEMLILPTENKEI